MKNASKIQAVITTAIAGLLFSAYSNAEYGNKKPKQEPLQGCYTVVKGSMQESGVDEERVIGTYRFVLVKQDSNNKRKRVVISGPIAGSE
ncbi:MAG: hypothetical protein ACKO96_13105, partial [Flammeovirgaceae bacterium]